MKPSRVSVLIFVAIFIGLVSAALWIWSPVFDQWARDQHYGEVSSVTDTSLMLVNKKNEQRLVKLTAETQIREGQNQVGIEALRLQSPVLVIGEVSADGSIEAKLIRVFPPKHR